MAGLRVVVHEEQAGVSQVVHVEELSSGVARAPHLDLGQAGLLSLVEPPHQGGQDMSVLQVEVVARPVQVGGHSRDEVVAVLTAVGLAQLDADDLGQGVALVGGFQRPPQQRLLGDRLVGQAGVDAGTPKVEQFLHPDPVGGLHHSAVDHQVVVEELGRTGAVGVDAPHRPGHQEHVAGPLLIEPSVHR